MWGGSIYSVMWGENIYSVMWEATHLQCDVGGGEHLQCDVGGNAFTL